MVLDLIKELRDLEAKAMPDLDFPVENEARPMTQAIDHAAGDIAEPDIEVIDEPEIVLEPTRSRRLRLATLLAVAAMVITGAAALAINMSDDGNDAAGGPAAEDSTAGGRYDCRAFGHPAVARPC